MIGNVKLSQLLRNLVAVPPQDITVGRTGPFLDVSGSQRLLAASTTGPVAANSTVTLGFMQALDGNGTGAKVLGVPVVTPSPAGVAAPGTPLSPIEEAQIGDLDIDNGFAFVAVTLASNNPQPVQGAAILILGDNRYNP